MKIPVHVLPHEVADGPANMALDEAMLDAVAAGLPVAFLRTYAWSTPTLSLGYFQHFAQVQSEPRWHKMPKVRRCSGGGAIWHHRELTYALVLPPSHPLTRPSARLYLAVHTAIALVLRSRGVRAGVQGDVGSRQRCEKTRALLCFAERSPEDVVAGGVKVAGSAQRRREGAVLQHGSLLLARSPLVPELDGLGDVANVSAEPQDWSDRLLDRFAAVLELAPVVDEVDYGALRAKAQELEAARYRNPAWTELR
jgi:lipoate-protein ligase A